MKQQPAAAIKGLRKDKLEILPGIARVMKVMSRIAPKFLLKQLGKPLEKMLAQADHLNAPA